MGTEANLIRGPLDIWVGPLNEPMPEIDDRDPGVLTMEEPAGNWVQIGFTIKDTDFEITYTPSFEDIRVNEATGPVDSALDIEDMMLTYAQAEHDLAAWNQVIHNSAKTTVPAGANQTAQTILKIGHRSTEAVMVSLLMRGKNPATGDRVIQVHKARSVEPAVFSHGRKHSGTPITWRWYEDTTKTLGERFTVMTDITGAASS
jgi:hypothetical protein